MPDTLKPSELTGGYAKIGAKIRPIASNTDRIHTPIPFLLDFARYATTREIEPAYPGAPDVEFTLDYALLAADLDVCGWPDGLAEAAAGLAPEGDKEEDAEIRASVNIRAGDYWAAQSPPNGGVMVTTNLCPASSIPVVSDILAEIAEERNRQTSEWADALFNYDAKFLAVGLLSLNAAVNADTEEAHKVLMALRDDRVGDRERLIAGAAMLLRAIELITPS